MDEGVITYKKGDGEKWKENKTVTKVIIDDDVTEIADYAFRRCTNLKTIVFSPNCKLKKIGHGAFFGTGLEEVHVPSTVEEIGRLGESYYGAFDSCPNLKKVTLSSNLKVLGAITFDSSKIDTIVLPEGLLSIGKEAFIKCRLLSTVIWPESVTMVESDVFKECTKLHKLVGSDKQDVVIAYLKASLFAKLCITGKLEEAKRAVEGDAEAVKQKDAGGRTPLHSFCQYGSSEGQGWENKGGCAFRKSSLTEVHFPDSVKQ